MAHKLGDDLKMRILFAKRELRELGMLYYTDPFMLRFPEYNTAKGLMLLRAVMNTSMANRDLTDKIELFIKEEKDKRSIA